MGSQENRTRIFGKMATLVEPLNKKEKRYHKIRMYETMFEVHKKYIPIKPIGKGSSGMVCLSLNQDTNEKVAIKKISNVFGHIGNSVRILREIKLLRHLQHKNVIGLIDVMIPTRKESFKDVYLVYELMDSDLCHVIKPCNVPLKLCDFHCKYLLFQLLLGLNYIHSANVLHRDLKPENMLIDNKIDLKICDFGLAQTNGVNGEHMTEYVTTRWYRAPELLIGCTKYGASIDMWSVGCIFAEILSAKAEPIFPGKNHLNQLELIVRILGSPDESDLEFITNSRAKNFIKSFLYTKGVDLSLLLPEADPMAIDLLRKMLVFNPTKRITVLEALQHPYMEGLYEPSDRLPAEVSINLDIDVNKGEDVIREMIWDEMLHYHPEAAYGNA